MSAQPTPDVNEMAAALAGEISPEIAREWLLRAVKAAAENYVIQDDPAGKDAHGQAALQFSQSYLLLDPTLDTQGLPAEGPGSQAHSAAAAAHQFPPRVQENPAAAASRERHKPQQQALDRTRGQRPTPSPRV